MAQAALKRAEPALHDSKSEILAKLGDLSGFEVPAKMLLLAIYMRPEMSPGGIIMTPNVLKEDKYQGKVCLVVKIGLECVFTRLPVALHDWIVVRPGDTWALDVNASPDAADRRDFWPCRLIFDDQIRAKVSNPAMIW